MIPSDSIIVIPLQEIASWQLKKREEVPAITCWAEVPSFQRGLVWRPAQIEVLWDSLMRGIPIGAISLLPIAGDNVRFKRGNQSSNLEGAYWLVDGQQRANAIAMGFKDFSTNNEAILWLDIHPDRSKRHRRKYFFYVTTPGRPWGYGIADDNDETRTSNVPTDEYRRVLLEEVQWKGEIKSKPTTEQLWPVKAGLPVPFSLLRNVFYSTNAESFAEEVLGQANADSNNWAQHFRKVFSGKDKAFEKEIRDELKFTFDGLLRVVHTKAIAMIAPEAFSGDETDDAEADEKSDIAVYFDRLNRGGTPPSREDLDYSILKSVVPELSVLDEYAEKLMHPSRMANIAMLTYFSLNNWKAGISRKEIYKLQNDNGFKSFILSQSDDFPSPFKEAIDTVLSWISYDANSNECGLPPVLCSQLAKETSSLFRLLLLLAIYSKRNNWKPENSFIVAFVSFVSWFSNEGKLNYDTVIEKIASSVSFEQIQLVLQQFISRQIESGMLLIPPRLADFERILTACAQNEPQTIRDSWNPIGYNAGLNHIWYWRDKAGRSLLLYSCRVFLSKAFDNYDPASAVWNEDCRPWDYDHIIPQDWVQSGRGNKQGEFHDIVWEFLMSVGNIAPVPFSINRSKHNSPPGDYLGDENSLAFVLMRDKNSQEPYYVREWPKRLLENDKDAACSFAYMTTTRWLALYREWLRLPVIPLLSAAGNNAKKTRVNKVAEYLKSKFSNVRIIFNCGEDRRDYDLADEWDWARPWVACGVEGVYRNNGTDIAKCFLCAMFQGDYCEVGLRKLPEEIGFNGTDQFWVPGCFTRLQIVDELQLDSVIHVLDSYIPISSSDNNAKFYC